MRDIFLSMMSSAVLSAFFLGNYSPPSDAMLDLYMSHDRRQKTKPASDARRDAGGVQGLIETLTRESWDRQRFLRKSLSRTAKEIQPRFNRMVRDLENLPKSWQPADSNDPKSVKNEIEKDSKAHRENVGIGQSMSVRLNFGQPTFVWQSIAPPIGALLLNVIISVLAGLPVYRGE